MNEDTLQELAALNAVGALEGVELQELEAQLASASAAVAPQMAAFNDLVGLLAISLAAPQEPPPDLKAKILSKITETAPDAEPKSGAENQRGSEASPAGFKFVLAAEQPDWQKLRVPGAWVKLLSFDAERGYAVVLGKLDAGARYPAHKHLHGEQIYVLSGDLHIGAQRLGPGDFHHADAGTAHGVNYSETGCVILAVISTSDLQAQMV
ncbi:MAG: cupin domain-containing protein [Verrucomicrobiales bacterium]|nr:cupin domain-containing protein [Verrucomicrobiales bacterium]